MTDQSERIWKLLPREQQFLVARSVARRRSREWQKRYANLLSAGAGLKTRRGRRLSQVVCLRFLVARKWKVKRADGIPEFFHAYVNVEGRRRRCAIPTDVEILGKGGPQYGFVARRASDLGGSVSGSACCRVRVAGFPGNLYLLGCHHVFARSAVMSGAVPDPTAVLFSGRGGSESPVGPLFDYTDLTPSPPRYGCDAALVRVDHLAAITPWLSALHPAAVSDGLSIQDRYKIATPRGDITGRFLSQQFGLTLPYGSGVSVRIETVYESDACTMNGDSGSALVADDGTLIGMHFYGAIRTVNGATKLVSLALPSYVLFRPGLFIGNLALS